MARSTFYAVEIVTADGPVVSRFFSTLAAARKWAAWTSRTWPSRILKGGQGGEVVK